MRGSTANEPCRVRDTRPRDRYLLRDERRREIINALSLRRGRQGVRVCTSESSQGVLNLAVDDPRSPFPLAFAKTGLSFVILTNPNRAGSVSTKGLYRDTNSDRSFGLPVQFSNRKVVEGSCVSLPTDSPMSIEL
jgi:hypothetical protein